MVSIIIEFEVSSFVEWKKSFNKNEEKRSEFQITPVNLYVSVENTDHIVCILEAPSIEHFENYYKMITDLHKGLLKDIVLTQPKVSYFQKINAL
jgi:hypothetical protein